MNYRHAFHAGNAADVFKHIVLVEALGALLTKAAALFVLDTHAGRGCYRFAEAGEFQSGIARLWPQEGPVAASGPSVYWQLLQSLNPDGRLRHYPGSPLIARACLRPQDRTVFIEQHPEEYAALRRLILGRTGGQTGKRVEGRPRCQVLAGDGWEAGLSQLPPHERRGLVLIDPPYERTDDFRKLTDFLMAAHKRFRAGVLLAWYPVKLPAPMERPWQAVLNTGAEALRVEFTTLPEDVRNRLNGSGMIVVNPPQGLAARLEVVLRPLLPRLAQTGQGRLSVTERPMRER